MCTARVSPWRAPATKNGPVCGLPNKARVTPAASIPPELIVVVRTVSPGQTVKTGGRSAEKLFRETRRYMIPGSRSLGRSVRDAACSEGMARPAIRKVGIWIVGRPAQDVPAKPSIEMIGRATLGRHAEGEGVTVKLPLEAVIFPVSRQGLGGNGQVERRIFR